MPASRFAPLALLASFGLAACSGGGASTSPPPADGPLAHAFAASAEANRVPRDLMVAVAAVEGGLTLPAHRTVDPDNAVPVAGPLELRHGAFDSLARGAALTGVSELALREDTDLGLDAGARVLAELGARTFARTDDLATWSDAVEELSGYALPAERAHYAHRVFALLARGGTFPARDGESIAIAPHDVPVALTRDLSLELRVETAPADYGPAEWFETPSANKWTPGRPNGAVDRIVIHDTEGGWDASVSTLQNDPNKSVHYIVGQDGRVGQFVHESDTAWHAGNWFYNTKSVGIEHVGYATQSYPDAEYAASAALVKYLAAKYGVPKDRTHIVGHDQIPNGNVMAEDGPPCEDSPSTCEQGSSYGGADNHRDPGDWEWCLYMVERLGGTCKCNDVWSLWNCSSDHTEAFRCESGKIEIEHCDGPGACVSQPNGVNDVCNVAPAASGDAGTAKAGDGGATPAPSPVPTARGDAGAGTPNDVVDVGASGGCTAAARAGGRAGAGAGAPAVALLGLALLGARRRRPRSTAAHMRP